MIELKGFLAMDKANMHVGCLDWGKGLEKAEVEGLMTSKWR